MRPHRLLLLPGVLALLCTVLALAAPPSASAATQCLFAAHRGYTAHATENGLRAMKRAIARGADYLEIDVQSTKDGRFVLMHDRTVERTTNGRGRIAGLTWEQVRRLRLDDGSAVPSLDRVLAAAKPTQTGILLEMKWIPASRFAALHRIVNGYGLSRVVVHSFSPYVARRFHATYPSARSGLDVARRISVSRAKSYGGVLPDYRHSTTTWLRNLKAAGVPTYLSTPNTLETWHRYTGRVTMLVTDRVVDYAAYRNRACS